MVTSLTKGDINVTVGTVNMNLRLKVGRDGKKSYVRQPSPPTRPMPDPHLKFSHFGYGCGAFRHHDGYYALALNGDLRSGWFQPGLREVVDLTGIAAGYRIKKIIKHGDVNFALTYNPAVAATKVYRVETTWVEHLNVAAQEGFDLVSFKDVIAVSFNTGASYQFSSDDGTNWTASTKSSGNADNAKYFLAQTTGLTAPRVIYTLDPNILYFTEDLTNTDATGSTDTTIGDNASDQQKTTSITEDSAGNVLVGMRHYLVRLEPDEQGLLSTVILVSKYYPDPPLDAGGQGDRDNFEQYAKIEDRIWYNAGGYDLVEYYQGKIRNEKMAPWRMSKGPIPRMQLPINAVTQAGEWVVLAVGTTTPTTLKNIAHAPAGDNLIQNTFGSTSDIYVGQYMNIQGNIEFVWHGIILATTDPLRYMWYDEDDFRLYLASGDAELINAQMLRARFTPDNPLYHYISSIIELRTGACTLETGRVDYEDPNSVKILRSMEAHTLGLATGTPSLQILYRPESAYDTATDMTSLVTYTANATAETGTAFPASKTFRTCWFQFIITGNANNTYAIMSDAELIAETFPERVALVQFNAEGASGVIDISGVPAMMSAHQIGQAMDTWQDGNALATITDTETGEAWNMLLLAYTITGLGQDTDLAVTAQEALA